jgi:2-iminobutanoate/2-iminopropanoate deaminase
MDMGKFATVNEVYARYFSDNFPARETVQVSGLPKGVQVEISVIAGM